MYAGPYGYELVSGGSQPELEDLAVRSLLYSKLHCLKLVFAMHFMVQRAGNSQQPSTFPAWPDFAFKADTHVGSWPIMWCLASIPTKCSLVMFLPCPQCCHYALLAVNVPSQ